MSLARDERIPTIVRRYERGPGQRRVSRPCLCGRSVWADRYEPTDGVAHHNRTREHIVWRLEHGL